MRPTKRRLLLGATILLLAALGKLGIEWHTGDEPVTVAYQEPTPGVQQRGGASQQFAGPAPGLQWRAGSSQRYKVNTDSSFRMGSASSTEQFIQVRLDGTLEVLSLEAGAAGALVGMRLSSVQLYASGATDAANNRALTTPFRVRFAADGVPTAFEFPADVTAEHRDVLENLVRIFQVTMAEGDRWTVQEANAMGTYEAEYVRNTPWHVEKTKHRFTGLAPATGGTADIDSKESFRLDPKHDWIVAMQVDETVQSRDPSGLAVHVTNHASLTLQPGFQALTADQAQLWRFVAAPPPAHANAASARAAGLSPDQAKKQMLDTIATLDAAREGRSVLIDRLRDLVGIDPALPAVLLEALRVQTLQDRTRADVFLALELAGTPAAQAALHSVLEDPTWDAPDAMRAIVALSDVAGPTEETVAALTTLSMQASSDALLAGTATLALGSLGNGLRVDDDPAYASVRANLLDGAYGGFDPYQRANYVHAIGNTGDASLSHEITALLDDEDASVRIAAARSLGRLGTNQVAEDLLQRFEQERTSVVRGAIAEALASWTDPTDDALASMRVAIKAERDENTRYHMARLLAAHPENRAVLQELLRTEQSKRIRQTVAEMLAEAK